MSRSSALCTLIAVVAVSASVVTPVASASDWSEVRHIDGVTVQARTTESGFDEHRGEVQVCTDLQVLEDFVSDTGRFREWLPYTRDAELLEVADNYLVYYVRTTTPWPMKDRDMVYQISRQSESDDGVTLDLVGLPDYQIAHQGAAPMREAEGRWRFVESDGGLDVSYQLFVNPGSVPPFAANAANNRMANAVGKTLANLASQFPCTPI